MKRRVWYLLLAVWTALSAGCGQGPWSSGDRVLVSKCMYDTDLSKPRRFDVVVFKYPVRPIERGVPKNYIKRLLGLPGEILAMLFGRIFVLEAQDGEMLFPEPQILTTKDGRTLKGFVVSKDDKKTVFEHVSFGPQRYAEEEFGNDQIEKLTPIPMADRWKHRPPVNEFDLAHKWGDPRFERFRRTVDETDFDNDFDFLYEDHPWAKKWFNEGKFKVLRKPPEVMLAMRRIVFDNDFQPKDLSEPRFRRWQPAPESAWKADNPTDFSTEARKDKDVSWMRYQHLVVKGDRGAPRAMPAAPRPQLITDFYGYNAVDDVRRGEPYPNWAGDLMLDCSVEVLEPRGEFWMELSRGIDRFQARFDLATGQCTLLRVSGEGKERKTTGVATVDTRMKAKGTYNVKFANFDARLMVWIDRDIPFEPGHADYDPPEAPKPGEFTGKTEAQITEALARRRGPTLNDLEPASIGVKDAAVRVTHLRLWRDTYYTRGGSGSDESVPRGSESIVSGESWDAYRRLEPRCYYVQPGHFMCLGDNSTMSSDGREWGLVPDRLMLGRAHAVYFPFNRAGPIK
ncbi:MAG: S26 family signal peptidase [Gemmataceae bacterium]